MFGFWDWVGGRYSVDSAIGLSLMIVDRAGRGSASSSTASTPSTSTSARRRSRPTRRWCSACSAIWYTNVLGAQTKAVLPYAHELRRFPAYLQQLDMESNGKRVRLDGSPGHDDTGPIVWGEPGTNGQHAFYQLLHQGTRLVPIDFIGFARPNHPLPRPARSADGQPVRPGRGAGVRQDAEAIPEPSTAGGSCSPATGRARRSSPPR